VQVGVARDTRERPREARSPRALRRRLEGAALDGVARDGGAALEAQVGGVVQHLARQ
jgi:hypothetical protein